MVKTYKDADMFDSKGYYKALGITEVDSKLVGDEWKKILVKRYRRKCKEFHPDLHPNDKLAEEKFKKVNEAYQFLSNDANRKAYNVEVKVETRTYHSNDQSTSKSQTSASASKPKQPKDSHASQDASHKATRNGEKVERKRTTRFEQMFTSKAKKEEASKNQQEGGSQCTETLKHVFSRFGGKNNKWNRMHLVKGQSVRITLELTIKEVYEGVRKKIRYKRFERSNEVVLNEDRIIDCPSCNGSGFVTFSLIGFGSRDEVCPICSGRGKIHASYIASKGVCEKMHEVVVDIPKGVANGSQFTMVGEGNHPLSSEGQYGDLVVSIKIKEEKNGYIKDGNNLKVTLNVPIIQALLGTTARIKALNGEVIKFNIPSNVKDGSTITFNGYGMPIYGTDSYGDMIAIVKLKMPNSISMSERNVLEELKTHANFK